MGKNDIDSLRQADLSHQIHPQFHVRDHENPVVYERGEGALLWDIEGKEYIDALSSLWNVAVGHGRKELADVAQQQMAKLAFSNSYAGYANVSSIQLAERLMELVYANMQAIFFCNSGSEAVDGALKIARFYWHLQGKPQKTAIIARKDAYHGGTFGATTVTGMAPFYNGFGPLIGGVVRTETCYPYRCDHCTGAEDCDNACADDIAKAIEREGADNVAAVIGEPVHGAGGVIPPTPGYWPRVREICDENDILLIADEVITGFGRTGKWFALEHWGVLPDIMTVAKAITSAYVPLAGFIVSGPIHQALLDAPATDKFMHGYTNAGHPTACAVGLRNLQIIEEEGLIERAAEMGLRLRAGLDQLAMHPAVGEIRSLGFIAAVELTADKATRAPFEPGDGVGPRVLKAMRERGVITRVKGDSILLAPPLVTTAEQVDRIVEVVGESINAVLLQ